MREKIQSKIRVLSKSIVEFVNSDQRISSIKDLYNTYDVSHISVKERKFSVITPDYESIKKSFLKRLPRNTEIVLGYNVTFSPGIVSFNYVAEGIALMKKHKE